MALVILTGPSTVGKSYIANLLVSRFADSFNRVPVYTTRPKRSSEDKGRVFITTDMFKDLISRDAFFVHESFSGHLYGYLTESLLASDRHLLIDVPPYFLPTFVENSDVLVVGLQAPKTQFGWFDARMQARGDSPQARQARKPYIERDVRDLNSMKPLVEKHGKLFCIKDNSIAPAQVVPWIVTRLRLDNKAIAKK